MPKRASEIWDQYQVVGDSANKKHVICLHCDKEYRHSHATRMVLHIIKCKKCPIDIKNKFSDKVPHKAPKNETPSEKNRNSMPNNVEFSDPNASTSFSVKCEDDSSQQLSLDQTSQLSGHRNQTEEADSDLMKKDEIDANLARAVYASGTPLSLLESTYWKMALMSLNPSYEPPTRHCLSNRLLDAEYSRVKIDTNNKIHSSLAVAIITDGWTNIHGKGVVNFFITTPEPIFYKSVYPNYKKGTAEHLSSEINRVIEEISPSKIVAFITDNAKNMKAAWRLVQKKYPYIAFIECVAHSLNLIYNDIGKLPTLNKAVDTVTNIIKCVIRNKHRAVAYIEKNVTTLYGKLKESLKFPYRTKLNHVVHCLESFDHSKKALQALAVAAEIDIEHDILTALLNDSIWATVKDIIKVLKPISIAITKFESDKVRISEVPIAFINLGALVEAELAASSCFQDHEKEIIQQAILKMMDFCVQPIHLAANFLDPRYMGSALTSDQEADANNFIHDQARLLGKDAVAVMTNVVEFRTKTAFFAKCHSAWITTETVAPHLWWQSFASKQELFPIAYRLLSVPPSSAAAAKNRSLFGNIDTKSRNRLQKEHVHKLITVRQNLKYLDDSEQESTGEENNYYDDDFEFVQVDGAESEVEEDIEGEIETDD